MLDNLKSLKGNVFLYGQLGYMLSSASFDNNSHETWLFCVCGFFKPEVITKKVIWHIPNLLRTKYNLFLFKEHHFVVNSGK